MRANRSTLLAQETTGAAGRGTALPVVWEGGEGNPSRYPIQPPALHVAPRRRRSGGSPPAITKTPSGRASRFALRQRT